MRGLGCASSQYLATAGVGRITLIDDDIVELSNLQRQVLHHDTDIGRKKVDSAADALRELNPHVEVNTVAKRLDDAQLQALIEQHTVVVDASDNVDTRNQLNRLCFATKTAYLWGGNSYGRSSECVYVRRSNSTLLPVLECTIW